MNVFHSLVIRFLGPASAAVSQELRLMRWCHLHGLRRAANLVSHRIQRRYGVFVPPEASLGRQLLLPHPVGIVIGAGVTVGKNVTIYQNVTLGGARIGDARANAYPAVGDGTVIFAGAIIVGSINIGKGCTIGANAVVLEDVPDGATAVGIPARILPTKSTKKPTAEMGPK